MSKKGKKKQRKKNSLRVNREYRSAVFKMYFSIKKNALDLYNALNGTDYKDENELELNSLENSLYLKIYNDVSFIISGTVNLYEHQSTVNPNMPLRDLFYISEIYKEMVPKKDIYGKKLITVPTPQFIVFYNGATDISDRQILRLSDSFIRKTDEPELELTVQVLNVNYGHNKELMEKCIPLRDYAILNERVRNNL
ncbi:MAG: Rpn family recombination-promoting nuclease/putative transposase, partial [Lachnospiraceae bacterium]|nr:Rpn family recombination-promoting nuclease/putative transposase [Lachnospiraceae bacterium]